VIAEYRGHASNAARINATRQPDVSAKLPIRDAPETVTTGGSHPLNA
jgi:hypothetical protein